MNSQYIWRYSVTYMDPDSYEEHSESGILFAKLWHEAMDSLVKMYGENELCKVMDLRVISEDGFCFVLPNEIIDQIEENVDNCY